MEKLTKKELVLILEERIISLNDSLFNCEDSGKKKLCFLVWRLIKSY